MKYLAIFALGCSLALSAHANESYATYARMQADAFAMAQALRDGGMNEKGESCAFDAKIIGLEQENLYLELQSDRVLGPIRFSFSSDLNDRLLTYTTTRLGGGRILRTYTAFGQDFMTIQLNRDESFQTVKLFDRQRSSDCSVER